ncbi:helix-turn-helix domain-containing protein [Dendrosporobacter sp. 1207_IL3150]|uniref:helix-turn-helix domain-containing protein n=1 Tax=Dendrosporobacter sp. 1207_IL3150 TaxID=3084054 RepID=UPI002FDA1C55
MVIEKLVLHVSEAANLLGVSSQKVCEMIQNRELCAYKAGKAWKIDAASLENYIRLRLKK